jgi:ElaB/YqjD/DUF883 family membrane-anchored ribosome-binding protein
MAGSKKTTAVEEKIEQIEEVAEEVMESVKEKISQAEQSMERAREILGEGYGTVRARSTEAYAKAKEYLAEARETLESVREHLGELYGHSREVVEELYAKAKMQFDKLVEQLRRGYARVKAKVEEIDLKGVRDDVVDYIQRNPGKAILVAVVVGFAVGYLVRPREA